MTESLHTRAVRRRQLTDALASLAPTAADDLAYGKSYLQALSAGGWAVPAWPTEHGGRDANRAEAREIASVLSELPAPDLYPFFVGLHMVGPTLLQHGTELQQRTHLRSIADGTSIWCQMFSEPDAGSDLANVALRAIPDGPQWRLTGQKIWTSRAHYADFGICLARTDPDMPKHTGLSMFIVPLTADGIEVRPLIQMNGDDHFSEVFLDEVVIDDESRVGPVGDGWSVAHTVLSLERGAIGGRGLAPNGRQRSSVAVPRWLLDLAATGKLADPVRRDRAMKVYIDVQVASLTSRRAAAAAQSGRPGPEASGGKIRNARNFKRRAYLIKDSFGADGMLTTHPGHDDALTAPSMSIRGGTDEIQLNILAERVLQLPVEQRSDRDVPWSRSRLG